MIMSQFKEIMANAGVSEIDAAAGTAFDPNIHNAVMHVEDEALGESVIAEEFQKGFKLVTIANEVGLMVQAATAAVKAARG